MKKLTIKELPIPIMPDTVNEASVTLIKLEMKKSTSAIS
jgi:hypothetical protein